MNQAYAEIQRLISIDARHQKGFRLSEVTEENRLRYAQGEISEMIRALDGTDEEQIDELADVLACLLHHAVRKQWTLQRIDAAILKKLAMRFPPDQTPPVVFKMVVP